MNTLDELYWWAMAKYYNIKDRFAKRGNDGLTDRERNEYARRYAEGIGRTPTREEFQPYREAYNRERAKDDTTS